jgi:hypothetical protein
LFCLLSIQRLPPNGGANSSKKLHYEKVSDIFPNATQKVLAYFGQILDIFLTQPGLPGKLGQKGLLRPDRVNGGEYRIGEQKEAGADNGHGKEGLLLTQKVEVVQIAGYRNGAWRKTVTPGSDAKGKRLARGYSAEQIHPK